MYYVKENFLNDVCENEKRRMVFIPFISFGLGGDH